MKMLIAPMATVAETGGSMIRTRSLALEAHERGHEVAFCAGQDINYRPLAGVKNYHAPIPIPPGLPFWMGKRAFSIAKRLGIQQRAQISDLGYVTLSQLVFAAVLLATFQLLKICSRLRRGRLGSAMTPMYVGKCH